MTITIVDYGHGNLYSIAQAFRHLNVECVIANQPEKLITAERIVLPGVGAFGTAMRDLRSRKLLEPLLEAASSGVPLLGICLGMQLLGTTSDEFGNHKGLDLIPGHIGWLPDGEQVPHSDRIPNVGWRQLNFLDKRFSVAIPAEDLMVYFTHSLHFCAAEQQDVFATTIFNNTSVVAAICRDNIMGFQFHPENSGEVGLSFLDNFLSFKPST